MTQVLTVPTALLLVLACAATMGNCAAATIAPAPLPYAENALEPTISARTISFHYGKHHKAYADKLQSLVKDTPLADKTLEEVIKLTTAKPDQAAMFNNAAQVWNHDFFWNCMNPNGGGKPAGTLAEKIERAFGSYDNFKTKFTDAAVAQFGSGWAWLVLDGEDLKIVTTSNADTPLAHGQKALFTVDVWEHAYYLDYQNRRKDFVEAFLDHLANWEFAASQLK